MPEQIIGSLVDLGASGVVGYNMTCNSEDKFMTRNDYMEKLIRHPHWKNMLSIASEEASLALSEGRSWFYVLVSAEDISNAIKIFEHFGFCADMTDNDEIGDDYEPQEGFVYIMVYV